MKRLLILSVLVAACEGKRGADGADGPAGPQGPIGPASNAPEILTVTPSLASPASIVRVRAAHVSSSATIAVDGAPVTMVGVTMLSTTSADLAFTGLPAGAVDGWGFAEVTVHHGGRTSNPAAIELAPAGATRVATRGRLLEPRGLAVAGDGAVLVFDLGAGVLRRDDAGTTVLHPATLATGALSTGLAVGDAIVAGGTGGRIVRIDSDGTVSVVANGLAADAMQIVTDDAGTLYWTDGTAEIRKLAADGEVTMHATLPESAFGLARIGSSLYASGASGDLHSIAIAGGASSVHATGVFARALAVDGTDVIACVNDAGGAGAVRVTAAGAKSDVAPVHGLVNPSGAHGCAVASGRVWTVSDADEALSSFALGGSAWSLEDVSLDDDGVAGASVGDRLVLVARNRCDGAGVGALLEVAPDGAVTTFATEVCVAGFAAEPAGTHLVIDARNGRVARAEVSGAPATTVFAGGGGYRGIGIARAPDGSFFTARTDADSSHPVTHFSAAGAEITFDLLGFSIAARGITWGDGAVWVATTNEIVRIPVDAQGTVGTPETIVPPSAGFIDVTAIAYDGDELVFALGTGEIFAVGAGGGVRWIDDAWPARGLAMTPHGELLVLDPPSDFPIARLP